jgi:hypothetical protein
VVPHHLLATKILYLGRGLGLGPKKPDLDLFQSHIQEQGQWVLPTYTDILPGENIDIHNPTYPSPPSTKSASAKMSSATASSSTFSSAASWA